VLEHTKTKELEMKYLYNSTFSPSSFIQKRILQDGRICAKYETSQQMVNRVVSAIYDVELQFSEPQDAEMFADNIGELMDTGQIVFSTPIMTNAGRSDFRRPLSACTVPSVNLNGDWNKVRKLINTYHQEAMGTGFNFDMVDDPVEVLLKLNEIALLGSQSGNEDRPVGNMGICTIDHPRIASFVVTKFLRRNIDWKFNISVDTPELFWMAAASGSQLHLRDGNAISASALLDLIVEAAHHCADPGVVFMDRINRDNPIPGAGRYESVAPCAEVGLVPGETCQFGYVNLGAFVSNGTLQIDKLRNTVMLLTQALDDCLEISLKAYQVEVSREIVQLRRKIGIGVCGLADMLIRLGIPYDSEMGRSLAKDVVALVNFVSKEASHQLGGSRGSFGAMKLLYGCRHTESPSYISQRYSPHPTKWVSASDWYGLGEKIRTTQLLRHSSTIALPPTGRSGLVISASPGVEPLFSLKDPDGRVRNVVRELVKDKSMVEHIFLNGTLPENVDRHVKSILVTSTDISATDHLGMVAALQTVVDESISKTINLRADATVSEVREIYEKAYLLGLKGMTMYREGSSVLQPVKLK
jgi:ribonucleoside-diphosphate reductase alpha chain